MGTSILHPATTQYLKTNENEWAKDNTMATPGVVPMLDAYVHLDRHRFVSLCKNSETLWNLESLHSSREDGASTSDITSASDPRLPPPRPCRGNGALSTTLAHTVHIPLAHRLTEACILLITRCFEQPVERS